MKSSSAYTRKGLARKLTLFTLRPRMHRMGRFEVRIFIWGIDAVVKAKMRIFAPLALHGQEWDTHSFKKADMLIALTKIICSSDCMQLGTKRD